MGRLFDSQSSLFTFSRRVEPASHSEEMAGNREVGGAEDNSNEGGGGDRRERESEAQYMEQKEGKKDERGGLLEGRCGVEEEAMDKAWMGWRASTGADERTSAITNVGVDSVDMSHEPGEMRQGSAVGVHCTLGKEAACKQIEGWGQAKDRPAILMRVSSTPPVPSPPPPPPLETCMEEGHDDYSTNLSGDEGTARPPLSAARNAPFTATSAATRAVLQHALSAAHAATSAAQDDAAASRAVNASIAVNPASTSSAFNRPLPSSSKPACSLPTPDVGGVRRGTHPAIKIMQMQKLEMSRLFAFQYPPCPSNDNGVHSPLGFGARGPQRLLSDSPVQVSVGVGDCSARGGDGCGEGGGGTVFGGEVKVHDMRTAMQNDTHTHVQAGLQRDTHTGAHTPRHTQPTADEITRHDANTRKDEITRGHEISADETTIDDEITPDRTHSLLKFPTQPHAAASEITRYDEMACDDEITRVTTHPLLKFSTHPRPAADEITCDHKITHNDEITRGATHPLLNCPTRPRVSTDEITRDDEITCDDEITRDSTHSLLKLPTHISGLHHSPFGVHERGGGGGSGAHVNSPAMTWSGDSSISSTLMNAREYAVHSRAGAMCCSVE